MSARARFSEIRAAARSARWRSASGWMVCAAFGATAATVSAAAAPGPPGLAGAALATLAAMIAVVDWRRFIIPDALNAIGLALGLAAAWFDSPTGPAGAVAAALIRAGATATIFYAFRFGYRRWRGREGLGLGDVKLAGAAGAWLDWGALPFAVEMATLGALAFVLIGRLVSRRPIDVAAKLPFGAFLAPAIWVAWLAAHWRF